MALGDKDEQIQTLSKDKERLQTVIKEKDLVIEKKERLIQEYKSDIERERREKADLHQNIKDAQKTIDENKYLLAQKGNSQDESDRKLEQIG